MKVPTIGPSIHSVDPPFFVSVSPKGILPIVQQRPISNPLAPLPDKRGLCLVPPGTLALILLPLETLPADPALIQAGTEGRGWRVSVPSKGEGVRGVIVSKMGTSTFKKSMHSSRSSSPN